MKPYGLIAIILLTLHLMGCKLIDKHEEIPSFVHIESFILETTTLQGSTNSKISDVWVYVNDNLEGVWELPATIPLHYQGSQNIKFYAGIKKNGVSANRTQYPFYTPFEVTLDLVGDSIIQLDPHITYSDKYSIWKEDFEDPGFKLNKNPGSDTSMFIVSSADYGNLLEGDAGLILMNSSNYYCEMRTNELSFNDFPKLLEQPCYLEMNYKCNKSFIVGLLHKDGGLPYYATTPLITLNPTTDDNGVDQWNKTYLYITDVTNFYPSATEFDIYISVTNSEAKDDLKLFFDNLKIIF